MMKALDADAVRRAVCNVDIPACVTEEQFAAVLGNVCAALQGLEAIESVPLEPLCVWLAGYAAPPNYALDAVIHDIDLASIVYTANDRAEAWERHIRTLMECGLLQEEQDGAD